MQMYHTVRKISTEESLALQKKVFQAIERHGFRPERITQFEVDFETLQPSNKNSYIRHQSNKGRVNKHYNTLRNPLLFLNLLEAHK